MTQIWSLKLPHCDPAALVLNLKTQLQLQKLQMISFHDQSQIWFNHLTSMSHCSDTPETLKHCCPCFSGLSSTRLFGVSSETDVILNFIPSSNNAHPSQLLPPLSFASCLQFVFHQQLKNALPKTTSHHRAQQLTDRQPPECCFI